MLVDAVLAWPEPRLRLKPRPARTLAHSSVCTPSLRARPDHRHFFPNSLLKPKTMRSPFPVSALLLGGIAFILPACVTPRSARPPGHSAHGGSRTRALDATNLALHPRVSTQLDEATVDRLSQSHAAYAEGIVRQLKEDSAGMLEYWTRAYEADPENETLALEVSRRRITRKEYAAAEKILTQAAGRADASFEVNTLLGLTLLQLDRRPEALASYRAALAKQADNPSAYAGFSRLLVDQGQIEEGLSTLDQALAKDPKEPGIIVQIAETLQLIRTKNPALAESTRGKLIECLDRAAALDPQDAAVLLRLAELNQTMGRSAEAEKYFKATKARAPRNSFAAARLAEMYLRDGKLVEATEQLEALSRDEPTNPVPIYYLGVMAMERRDAKRAQELFERTLALDPTHQAALLGCAEAQLLQKEWDEALTTLEKARTKFGPDFRTELLGGRALSLKKDHAGARERFLVAERIATTNDPTRLDFAFYFQLGLACSELPNFRMEAEQHLQKALTLAPKGAQDEVQNALGYLWADQGIRLPEARTLIEAAVAAAPENPAYLDSLGWVLFKLSELEAAVKPLERAVELMKKEPDPTLLDHLADVLAALGRWAPAREYWEQALKLAPNDVIRRKLEGARGHE